mgnify:CR=1 FL=1
MNRVGGRPHHDATPPWHRDFLSDEPVPEATVIASPVPTSTADRSWVRFALRFDGYAWCAGPGAGRCERSWMVSALEDHQAGKGLAPGMTLDELRAMLFLFQRRYRWNNDALPVEEMSFADELLKEIGREMALRRHVR